MSGTRPHLVFAKPTHQRDAERLLGRGVVLENAIEKAILNGRKRPWIPPRTRVRPLSPEERFVLVDGERRVGAILVRGEAPLTGRKAWHVRELWRL
jgi:hypothetical protein